jgi:hypothetical protein
MGAMTTAAELADATPDSRDRYVDFLRALSIGVVVLGHWLMAVVTWDDGEVDGTNLLALVTEAQHITWVFQVMPVFFFVGGFANLRTWDAVRRRGGGYAEFELGRVERLTKPVGVLLAVWLPVSLALEVSPLDEGTVHTVGKLVVQLLWFLGVYLLVVAAAPAMASAHRQFGLWVPAVLVAVTVAVDVAHEQLDVLGQVNFVTVWFFAHQLGFLYADGTLLRGGRRTALALAATGLAGLVLLTTAGPYPTSMVGLPGQRSNMDPPTVCIVALTVLLVGLVLLARPAVTRWLQGRRPWRAVVALNGVIMSVFLWHLSALMIVVLVAYPLGFPQPVVAGRAWWALRVPWLALLLLTLAALVAVVGRWEQPRRRRDRARPEKQPVRLALATVGVAAVFLGVTGFALAGLDNPLDAEGARLVVFSVNPLLSLVHLVGGVALLRSSDAAADALPTARAATVVLGLLSIGGLLLDGRANVLALSPADAALHGAMAAGVGVAWWLSRWSRSTERPGASRPPDAAPTPADGRRR